jgi:hypothetical protein
MIKRKYDQDAEKIEIDEENYIIDYPEGEPDPDPIVNGNLKFLNSGKIKFPTCKFLTSKLRSCVDANREEVPHVERFIRRRFKHQRDCSANRSRP